MVRYRSKQELTKALAPVKVGYGKVQEALKKYATDIIPAA